MARSTQALRFILCAAFAVLTAAASGVTPEEWEVELGVSPSELVQDDTCPQGDAECALSLRQLRGELKAAAVAAHAYGLEADGSADSPSEDEGAPSCVKYGCATPFTRSHSCQCNDACEKHHSCCADYTATCMATAAPAAPTNTEHVPGEDADCHTATPQDSTCYKDVRWAMRSGINQHPADYKGLSRRSSFTQFQLWFYNRGLAGCRMPCGVKVSKDGPHTVYLKTTRGVAPPKHPFEYNGIEWPAMTIEGTNVTHIFAVGDWGGLPGQLPHNSQIIQYKGGQTKGPHTMGRYRVDARQHFLTCSTPEMSDCFGTEGQLCMGNENVTGQKCCKKGCGWNKDIDEHAQHLVAEQMKKRAKISDPKYILNVGDNFYWGGIYGKCGGTPMTKINDITQTQFSWIFEQIYSGPGLDGKPWLTVLGNHDWGGREFTAAWDQQIAYTWTSDRWVLPAPYWMQHVDYPDQGFSVDIFLTDSNVEDALKNTSASPEHNICGDKHNAPGASCASVGGVPNVTGCHAWYEKLWDDGAEWVQRKLRNSTADWQILVTHFPCGHRPHFYRELHQRYGLDLMVTGHVHFQMFYWAPERLGGLTCFITGGGGGITSENEVDLKSGHDHQYGFFDLTISKETIGIESINWNGTTIGSKTVRPTTGWDTKGAGSAGCHTAVQGEKCFETVTWAKNDGIHAHPEWYPGLTSGSSFEDVQLYFWKQNKAGCTKPC